MFEDKTFESILSTMLAYVSENDHELDTRTGSIIYTALAPIALELETAYHEMDMLMNETFLETASKEYLVRHGDQVGIELIDATFAHFEGEFNVDLEVGTRFNLDKFNYNVINKLSDPTEENPYYRFELVCETSGSEPNSYLGDLTPISYVANLSYAKLTSVLIYGEDEEDTEAYRHRLQIHCKNPPINGNVAQYVEWLEAFPDVGSYIVTPCWNGTNTVKLTISNSNNRAVQKYDGDGNWIDGNLVEKLQDYIDPPTSTIIDTVSDPTYPQGRGMGNGQAPIGSIVTVDTVTEVPVKIECTVSLTDENAIVNVQKAVDSYLNSLALNKFVVGYMPISAEIYNVENVEDVIDLTITVKGRVMDVNANDFIPSVALLSDEIPVLDTANSVWSVQ